MKKLFIVLAVASLGFVACNNESANEEAKTDSVVNAVDSAANAAKDSLGAVVDSAKAKVDSTVTAVKDSLKK
ncbi:MAG: hypothetical protein E6Q24_02580 [Chitinophagaceae bacterium]|nr:hypothetical protein [Sphingobacteriales bacterium]OJW03271.1 MAG: hypothetical protein BGO52_23150 [Sphingobacteriales bacterium 44-61]TXJ29301.1 MAG: hypothetical protein E6Q24_02580 [Chitinophagaceae bacterium]